MLISYSLLVSFLKHFLFLRCFYEVSTFFDVLTNFFRKIFRWHRDYFSFVKYHLKDCLWLSNDLLSKSLRCDKNWFFFVDVLWANICIWNSFAHFTDHVFESILTSLYEISINEFIKECARVSSKFNEFSSLRSLFRHKSRFQSRWMQTQKCSVSMLKASHHSSSSQQFEWHLISVAKWAV